MSKSWVRKLAYGSVVALLLTFSTTAALFAQDMFQENAPGATATVPEPATNTPVPTATNTAVPADTPTLVPTNTPVPPATEPVQIPEPITVVLFGSGLAALSASVAKRRKSQ